MISRRGTSLERCPTLQLEETEIRISPATSQLYSSPKYSQSTYVSEIKHIIQISQERAQQPFDLWPAIVPAAPILRMTVLLLEGFNPVFDGLKLDGGSFARAVFAIPVGCHVLGLLQFSIDRCGMLKQDCHKRFVRAALCVSVASATCYATCPHRWLMLSMSVVIMYCGCIALAFGLTSWRIRRQLFLNEK
jgi:hypothetical protein